MIYKARTIPRELEVYQLLNSRKNLLDTERKHLYALQKGYEGELLFDELTSSIIKPECLLLNDLLLSLNKNTFQIDSLIIFPETIYIFEVKNFEGDYFYEQDRLFRRIPPDSEVTNPLIQLNRSESLFRQLLQQFGNNMTIQSYLVFVNPEFTLYQAPIIKQIVYPGQINRFLKSISPISLKLDSNHYGLADKLKSLHNPNAPFYFPPSYQYDELQKGSPCLYCNSLEFTTKRLYCYCLECGKKETMEKRILQIVHHFTMLFPDIKITTNAIFDWVSGKLPKRVIRRVLQKHLNTKGVNQWSYYEY